MGGRELPPATQRGHIVAYSIRPVVLGQSEGKDVVVAHGRYGYYLKWDGSNIALPMKYRNDISSLTLEQAVELIRRKKGEA